jgi:hypothetical protein
MQPKPTLPEELRIPRWLTAVLVSAMAAGVAFGVATTTAPPALKMIRAIFFAAAMAYLTISIVDFWEHWRLEREAGGGLVTWRAMRFGETVNHAFTTVAVVGFLVLARPPPPVLEWRDWVALSLPAAFLLLGWRDELIYHRRRCAHREDIMHTVAHLAAGLMICSFALSKMVGWSTNS